MKSKHNKPDEKPVSSSELLGVKTVNESVVAVGGNSESIEWDKIPRLSLSKIVLSLGCQDILRLWGKRLRLSEARLSALRDQWIRAGSPNPEELLGRFYRGYIHQNDCAGMMLLCSYFDYVAKTPNERSSPTREQKP